MSRDTEEFRTYDFLRALSDALDVAASLRSWRDLPRTGRWLVAASAGGAALIGAAGAWAVRSAPDGVAA
jgi:hypothetical protein